MRCLLSLLLLLGAAATRADSGDPATVALIRQLEQQRIDAGLRKDIAALSDSTADDYLQIDLAGNVRDKPTQMRRLASSEVSLRSNTLDDMVVRVYGETAVVTGRATASGTIRGEPYPQFRYTRVYVKRGGRWQVVLFQQTRTTAAAHQ